MLTLERSAGLDLTPEQERRAEELHFSSIVIDCSSVLKQEPSHIERARAGGVTATNHTVTRPPADLVAGLKQVNMCRRWIDENPRDVLLATTVRHIYEAKASNREAVIFGPQNAEMIGTDLDLLGTFYDLGVRIVQLTYQRRNYVGSGCGEERDGGLSSFGRQLVSAMDELGVVVDLSHCGWVTTANAIEHSRNPVVFSHAHPYTVSPHIRAKSDDLIRALAARGGVMGITALSAFLFEPEQPKVRPTLKQFARHVRYVADLVGVDHVGIGMDFDETNTPEKHEAAHRANPELANDFGWDDRRCAELTHAGEELNITRALVWDGFSDDEIRKILGLNFLRVFQQVWKT